MTDTSTHVRQWGDFQTPPELVREVVQFLESLRQWTHVLEPTCGEGNFVEGARTIGQSVREIMGLDVSPEYAARTAARFAADDRVTILHADIFKTDLRTLPWLTVPEELLVLGNPPWVTSAEIGSHGGSNLPNEDQPQGAPGYRCDHGIVEF